MQTILLLFLTTLLLLFFRPSLFSQETDTLSLRKAIEQASTDADRESIQRSLEKLSYEKAGAVITLCRLGLQTAPAKESNLFRLMYLTRLGSAFRVTGAVDSANHYFHAALGLSEEIGTPAYLPAIWLGISILHWEKQEIVEAHRAVGHCISYAETTGKRAILAKCYQVRGEVQRMEGKNEEAVLNLEKAIAIANENGVSNTAISALNGIAGIRFVQERFVEAIDYFTQARDYAAKEGIYASQATFESNLGFTYLRLEQMDKAKAAMLRGLNLAKKSDDKGALVHGCYNLSELYFNENNLDSARYFAQQAFDLSREVQSPKFMSAAAMILADVAMEENNLPRAAYFVGEAERLSEESGDVFTLGYSLFQKGQLTGKMGEWQVAIDYFLRAIDIFQQTEEMSWESRANKEISDLYKQIGDFRKAMTYFEQASVLEDSINIHEQLQQIAALEKQFDLEKKDTQIDFLKKENQLKEAANRKNQLIILALVLILGLAVASFVLFYRQRKLQLEKDLAEVKQGLLRQQMNPHFIFNALNSIQNQLLKGNPEISVLLLGKFSKLMRLVLNNSDESFIPIQAELELLRVYLDLEQLRTDGKFEYEIQVDENVDIYNELMPSMVTQIFVENAVWHGIALKKEKGRIQLDIHRRNGAVVFCVQDDGVGRRFSMRSKTSSQKSHKSMGTQLVKDRIQHINRKFSRNIRLRIEDGATGGTKVSLVLT